MANKARQYHEGFWYHVYARGLQEVPLFISDAERKWFLQVMDEVFVRRRVNIGALSLMGTHYHMLLKMGSIELDKALQPLHMLYVKYVNKKRDRGGPLFRSRPGADIVLDEVYLQQLVPYIHLNAVKAAIVKDPKDYKWHADSLYRGEKWRFPLKSWLFPPGFEGRDRNRIYKEVMGEKIEYPECGRGYIGKKNEWKNLKKRKKQRKSRFADRRKLRTMDEIAQVKAREGGVTVSNLKEKNKVHPEVFVRQEAMYEMYREGYGPTAIGDYFKRSKSTVMHAINKRKRKKQ